jgi:hypothetical protein
MGKKRNQMKAASFIVWIIVWSISGTAWAHSEAAAPSLWQNGWVIAAALAVLGAIVGWVMYGLLRGKLSQGREGLSKEEWRKAKMRLEDKRNTALGSAIVLTLAFAIFAGLAVSSLNPEFTFDDLQKDAAIDVASFPEQEFYHLKSPDEKHEPYNSVPPTSGPHRPDWADYGYYEEAVDAELLVHNLEHGDIVIYYPKDTNPTILSHLQALSTIVYEGSGVLVVPMPEEYEAEQIVATAWTKLLKLDSWDEAKLETFISQFIYKGPEKLPPQHQ